MSAKRLCVSLYISKSTQCDQCLPIPTATEATLVKKVHELESQVKDLKTCCGDQETAASTVSVPIEPIGSPTIESETALVRKHPRSKHGNIKEQHSGSTMTAHKLVAKRSLAPPHHTADENVSSNMVYEGTYLADTE